VQFHIEQRFAGPVAAVEAAFCSPELLSRLASLPKVGGAELLEQRDEGATFFQRVRYRFTGDLSSAVTAVVDPEKLSWVEESTLDRENHVTRWKIVPDNYGSRLTCAGTFRLSPKGDDATVRSTDAEIKVHFPLVGGRVEKAIVSGLKEHAAAEEAVVNRYLNPA
jgi:hypothetical protein